MANKQERAQHVLDTKNAIKAAIIERGIEVNDIFSSYPEAIRNIQGLGSGDNESEYEQGFIAAVDSHENQILISYTPNGYNSESNWKDMQEGSIWNGYDFETGYTESDMENEYENGFDSAINGHIGDVLVYTNGTGYNSYAEWGTLTDGSVWDSSTKSCIDNPYSYTSDDYYEYGTSRYNEGTSYVYGMLTDGSVWNGSECVSIQDYDSSWYYAEVDFYTGSIWDGTSFVSGYTESDMENKYENGYRDAINGHIGDVLVYSGGTGYSCSAHWTTIEGYLNEQIRESRTYYASGTSTGLPANFNSLDVYVGSVWNGSEFVSIEEYQG